jgi:4-hydroxy-tetrahydrodipicolinate synthase
MSVAEKGELPVVLYNVPGRAGVPISEKNIARMSANPLIVAVKEAGGNVERVSKILDMCDITVLSGDDALTLPMMSVGAKGIISVASNLIPGELSAMVEAALNGDFASARAAHRKYYPLFCNLFIESNPIPVKAAMGMTGAITPEYRLPLCEISAAHAEVLKKTLVDCGIL